MSAQNEQTERPVGKRTLSLGDKVAINSVAQGIRQVVVGIAGLVSVALASRYLSIDEYGGILAALALVLLFSLAGDFGITVTTARLMSQEPERQDEVSAAALWTWIMFASVTAAAALIASQMFYAGDDQRLTRDAVLILLSIFALTPIGGIAQAVAIVEQRVWLIAVGTIAARCLSLAGVVLTVTLDLGPLAMTGAFAAGFVFDSLFAFCLVRPKLTIRWRSMGPHVGALIAAAAPLGAIMMINSLYFKVDAFLVSVLGSAREVALYGVAYKGFEMLLVLPGFLMITLLPVLARLDPADERFSNLVQKAFTGMCLLATPIVVFALLGKEIMVALAGEQYADGGLVLSFVLVSVAMGCITGMFGQALVAQGRQGILLKVAVTTLVVNVVANVIAIPTWGAQGAAGALFASEIVSLALTLVVFRGIAPLPRVETPLRFLAAGLAMAAVVSLRFTLDNDVVRLLLSVVLGGATYVAVLAVLQAIPSYVSAPFKALVARRDAA